MDLLSDMYMIYTYATTGQKGTAVSLAIMVGLCILGQLFVVWGQTHKGPKSVMLKEMLIVLSGLQPGWEAARVANGVKRGEHAAMDPEVALTCTRCFEMAMEAVPGSILQVKTLMQAENVSKVALASIIMSALTTGFSAATISFE
jgi:hypothetical protein